MTSVSNTEPVGSSPLLNNARDRLSQAIHRGFSKGSPVLIEALPSIGKSYGVVAWAAETGNPLTVLTARRDLYTQCEDCCEEHGLSYKRLPSFHVDCETANGTHGTAWATRVNKVYQEKSLFGGEIHAFANELFGESLPCQEDGACSFGRVQIS